MNTSRSINQNLQDQLRQASLTNLEQQTNADSTLYELQQQEKAEKSNLLMELSAGLSDGSLDMRGLSNILSLAGYSMEDLTSEQLNALGSLTPDYSGTMSVSETAWSKLNDWKYAGINRITAGLGVGKNTYKFGGETYKLSAKDMAEVVKQRFAGKPGMDYISVEAKGKKIVFKVGNKNYKTYNDAYAALTGKDKQ